MSLTPVTVNNAVNTSADQLMSWRNYADSTTLRVCTSGFQTNYAYVYFSRAFPIGATVISATLRLYTVGSMGAATRNMTAKRITETWAVKQLTWNNKPAVTDTGAVTVQKTTALSDAAEWAFDVQAHMQLVADGGQWFGWRLELDDSTLRTIYSAQAAGHKPTLEVTYSTAPQAPSTLSPSGNRAVSVAKPTLRFDFTDIAGGAALDAIHVQINATDSWGSPSFDSGTVITGVPELDLTTTAYAGLAADASTYWRVRVRDVSGEWSDWSVAAQFQRKSKGTVTIINPGASPNNFVEEATPPISWSVGGGRTQRSWQVIILDVDGNWLTTSGKVDSTATAWTPPDQIIHDDTTYTVAIRMWDTIERESTPNDPAYVEATRSFTYHLSGTVGAVTSFVGTGLSPVPGIHLTWNRASMPDSYTIVRDGLVSESAVNPADLLISGTSYEYYDYTADPRVEHTWEVRPVVNGVTADSNPQVTLTLYPVGIWITDPERNLSVMLVDQDSGSWAMGEEAEIYTPLGASKPIRITQALRGYEGNVAGRIIEYGSVTCKEWEARLWQMKETPGRTYQLTLSDMTIPVIIGNLTITPLPEPEITKWVSFDFWQVGRLPFRSTL